MVVATSEEDIISKIVLAKGEKTCENIYGDKSKFLTLQFVHLFKALAQNSTEQVLLTKELENRIDR